MYEYNELSKEIQLEIAKNWSEKFNETMDNSIEILSNLDIKVYYTAEGERIVI